MYDKVFVNRILNMKKIKYIGLDMDHTLIRYKTKNFESLVYRLVIEKLILEKDYPPEIRDFKFNFNAAIRGLIIDSKNGNILKLSRYAAIRKSYHGTEEISFREQKKIYRSIYVDLKDPNYIAIDTSFSIAFCVLYAQLIDLKDCQPTNMPNYRVIAFDVINSVDKAHSDGSLKNAILADLDKYVLREKAVVEGIARYIRYGKKFFLLTNSEYNYSNSLLDYALSPFLEPGNSWHSLFEFVITLADKPRFFYDDLRFLVINPQDGAMMNLRGKIKPGSYQGGNARQFTEDLALNGDEILYLGDHIYGDILRLKKDCNWRTALVIEELGTEIKLQRKALPTERKIADAMQIKKTLERKNSLLYSRSVEEGTKKYQTERSLLQQEIAALDRKISKLLQEEQSFYNPYWGRVFRAGAEENYFAYQVDRFPCILQQPEKHR